MNFTKSSVSIDRKDLTKWTELCESARIKLTKSEVNKHKKQHVFPQI
jgi:hypothetical protein